MDDLTHVQLSCLLLGKELSATAKLPDADAAKNLLAIARKIRDVLITAGLRKRKKGGGRKKKEIPPTPAPAAKPKRK